MLRRIEREERRTEVLELIDQYEELAKEAGRQWSEKKYNRHTANERFLLFCRHADYHTDCDLGELAYSVSGLWNCRVRYVGKCRAVMFDVGLYFRSDWQDWYVSALE